MNKKLAPSILSADFKILGEQVETTYDAGAEFLHYDVMDGMFVPSISFGMPVLKSIKSACKHVMDVHLMIMDPIRYIDEFKEAGADFITVHVEACDDVERTIDKIHECGLKAGVSVKPNTSLDALLPVIDKVEMVLIMSVEPGFGGQKFIPSSLDKIAELKKLLNERNSSALIEVDGGISAANAKEVLDAGADVLVAGSAVFKNDIAANVKEFVEIFKDYE